jgi:hypothetical protein
MHSLASPHAHPVGTAASRQPDCHQHLHRCSCAGRDDRSQSTPTASSQLGCQDKMSLWAVPHREATGRIWPMHYSTFSFPRFLFFFQFFFWFKNCRNMYEVLKCVESDIKLRII